MKSLCRIQVWLLFGIFFAALGFATYALFPIYFENLILQNFILSPDSASFKQWSKTNVPIQARFYMFNITNPTEALNGSVPIVEEIGPLVYRFEMEKQNIRWNQKTVDYRVVKRWKFDAKLTKIPADREVYHYNVPLMSAIAQISDIKHDEERYTSMESLNSMIEAFDMKLIRKNKIHELLFDGYEDDLLKVAAQFFPKIKPPTRFGFFFGRNDTSTDGAYTTYTGQHDNGRSLGLMRSWRMSETLHLPDKENQCTPLNQVSAGDFQVPFFLKNGYHFLKQFDSKPFKAEPLYMFIGDMCREFRLDYKEDTHFHGDLAVHRYISGPNQFNYSLPEAQCHCHKKTCPPNGLYHMGACAKGAPVYLSHPHFLYGDSELVDKIQGIKPEEKKHTYMMDFSKHLAVPANVNIRLQVNLHVKKNQDVEIMAEFPDDYNFYLPQFWSETHVDIGSDMAAQLSILIEKIPLALFIIAVIFAIFSVVCFTVSVILLSSSSNLICRANQVIHYESVDLVSQIDPKEIHVSTFSSKPL